MSIVPGTENPQQPSMTTETFLPDQLIGGRFPIITAPNAFLTGTVPLQRGTVLGQSTQATGTVTTKTGNVGNGTVGNISLAIGAPIGTYTLVEASPTTFNVTAPNGDALGIATAGTQFNNQISFLIAAGATAFAAADGFTITGEASSGLFKISVATATDGSQVPCGVLGDYADPTLGNVPAAVYLTGEFNVNALTFDPSWTQAALAPKLRQSGIYLKNSVSAAPPISSV